MAWLIEEIRKSCPAVQQGLVNPAIEIPIVSTDNYDPTMGKASCEISPEVKLNAGIGFGCRHVTSLSSTGCPLRDGVVDIELPVEGL